MSEEEKNALHLLANTEFETYEYTCNCSGKNCNADSCLECYEKMQKIIINLIKKQQKEIEQLKTDYLIPDYINEQIQDLKSENREYKKLLEGNLYTRYLYYKGLYGKSKGE